MGREEMKGSIDVLDDFLNEFATIKTRIMEHRGSVSFGTIVESD